MSNNNLINQFKDFLLGQSDPPSKVTVKNYISDINKFIRWFENKLNRDFQAEDVNQVLIDSFKQDCLVKYSASSVERSFSSLRKFFYFLRLDGQISHSPFEEKQTASAEARALSDPWRIRDFKNHLYVFNASHLTIKNYIIDVKQFLNWVERVSTDENSWEVSKSNIFSRLSSGLIEEYKKRLLGEARLSPVSINRKLSSIRRYVSWAGEEGLIREPAEISNVKYQISNKPKSADSSLEIGNWKLEIANTKYSSFPPFRVIQKTKNGLVDFFDSLLIYPLAHFLENSEQLIWIIKGRPVFNKNQKSKIKNQNFDILNTKYKILDARKISNISKSFYAPAQISTKYLPLHKKIWHHACHTRPEWYIKYHSYSFVSYLHFSILMLFISIMGYSLFNSFNPEKQPPTLAALPSAPPRILSFQGRLTDSSDNPITTQTTLRMGIYNSGAASGSALLWQEVVNPTPDSDGAFSIILGKNTAIPQSLFAQNSALWLGVTVGQTSELTPRQQIATVAFAANAETLQGLSPITNTTSTANVVLALNSSGNLTIGGTANPTFQATGGIFTLSGKAISITTTTSSNGNIVLTPDGTGKIDLQKVLQNTSNNNSLIPGSVEVDDLFAILGSSGSQAILSITQNSTGDLIIASVSGSTKFRVSNSGTITNSNWNGTKITSTYGGIGIDTSGSTGVAFVSSGTWSIDTNYLFANHGGTGQTSYSTGDILYASSSSTLARLGIGTGSQCLIGGTNPSWSSCSAASSNWWNQTNGAIYPNNSTVDLLLGGTATTSAKFAFLNVNSGTPTASVSSGLSGTSAFLTADGTLATQNRMSLTIGNSSTYNTTGDVLLQSNGTGSVGIGTTTPGGKVEISQSSTTNTALAITGNFGTGGTGIAMTANAISEGKGIDILVAGLSSGKGIQLAGTSQTAPPAFTGKIIDIAPLRNMTTGTTSINDTGNYLNVARSNSVSVANTFTISGDLVSLTSNCTPSGGGVCADTSSILSLTQSLASASGSVLKIVNSGSGIGLNLSGNGATAPAASISAQSSFAALLVDNTGVGDLFTASKSGARKFTILNNGDIQWAGQTNFLTTLSSAATAARTITFPDATGTICVSGSTCATSGTVGYWNLNSAQGTLFPGNSTVDLLLGGTATTSAKFAFLNIAGGTPTASISASSGNNATYLTGLGSLQTTNRQTLTLGGTTTGDIQFLQGGLANSSIYLRSNGDIGIGTGNRSPLASLDIRINTANAGGTQAIASISGKTSFAALLVDNSGAGDLFTASSSGLNRFVIKQNGNVGIGTSTPQAQLDIAGSSSTITNTSGNITITPTANLIISSGNVGIGTTAPGFRLDVQDSQAATAAAQIFNTNTGTDADGLIIKLGNTSTTVASTTNHFISFETSGIGIVGSIQGNGGKNVAYVTNGIADLAEYMGKDPNQNIPWGSLLCQNTNGLVNPCSERSSSIVGVASQFPTFVGGQDLGAGSITVGLAGIVSTRVSAQNGEIKSGDYIAMSDTQGVGAKAIKPGQVVGIALEPFDGTSFDSTQDKQGKDSVGKILVRVVPSWYDPDIQLADNGSLTLKEFIDGSFEVQRDGRTIDRIGAFSDLVVARVKSGYFETGRLIVTGSVVVKNLTSETLASATANFSQLSTDSLAVLSDQLTIGGQNIRDFIAGIIDERISQTQISLISPIKIENNNVVAKLPSPDSTFEIRNSSNSAVATFDSEGNASFSGQLLATSGQFNNLTIEQLNNTGDASISGTLRVKRIIANQIELSEEALLSLLGLEQDSSTSATYITNNYNYSISSSAGELLNGSIARIATAAGTLEQFNNLTIEQLTIAQGLMSYGPASFFEASVADRLFVGSQLSLADKSINVLGGNLELQPLKQGGIAFVGGEVEIDTDGNLKVNGNAYFAKDLEVQGNLFANIISPLPDQDLIFNLAPSSDSPELRINNSSHSAILTINSFGDLSASGAGTFNKLNLSIVNEALAISPTEVIATGSAGTAQIQPNRNELTVKNPLVTENSLIYITPKTSTPNQSVYLLRQVPGGSFTVGISQPINKKVPFNWILIN